MTKTNTIFIPSEIQCFWCNGRMRERGVTRIGCGLNNSTYFCQECGGIAHFARYDDRTIKTFTIGYDTKEKEHHE